MNERPNILLIVMDCARFDYLSAYGNPRATTPNLDRLAADGLLFENAFAAAPWTPPSHASLFTGTYPSRHGVDVNENLHMSEKNRMLAEILSENGYRTFGILPDVHLSSVRGFHRGLQEYTELWRIPYLKPEYDWLYCLAWNLFFGRDKRTHYTNRVIKKWLKRNSRKTEPFFIFVNYKTAHNRYQAPFAYRRKFAVKPPGVNMRKVRHYSKVGGYSYMARQLDLTEDEFLAIKSWYSGAIGYLDSRLGELIQYLKEIGVYNNTLVIVTSDHGENLGEHHLAYHLFSLYDTLMHVPLLMSCPDLLPHGRRIPGLVSLTDVVPTILDLLGLDEESDHIQGTSLVPFDGRKYHDSIFAEFGRPQYMLQRLRSRFPSHDFSSFDKGLRCIRTEEHKFIAGSSGTEELYDLKADPSETCNRLNELPDIAADLRFRLNKWRASMERPSSKDHDAVRSEDDDKLVTKALRELGYF